MTIAFSNTEIMTAGEAKSVVVYGDPSMFQKVLILLA
jgi:hypothetical protein